MWRLIIATFGFLALAFYELSGGSDYVPGEYSIQRQGAGPHQNAKISKTSDSSELVAHIDDDQATELTQRVEATLASLPVTRIETPKASSAVETEKVEALTHDQTSTDPSIVGLSEDADDAAVIAALQEAGAEMRESSQGAIALFARAQREADTRRLLGAEPKNDAPSARDIRIVDGDLVNMRGGPGTEFEKVAALTGGTEIVVFQEPGNGWLEVQVLETGQVGWMADWLVTTAFEAPEFSDSVAGTN